MKGPTVRVQGQEIRRLRGLLKALTEDQNRIEDLTIYLERTDSGTGRLIVTAETPSAGEGIFEVRDDCYRPLDEYPREEARA